MPEMNPTRNDTPPSKKADCGELSGRQRAGLYIHVPFCRCKCPYCDFYSITATQFIPAFVGAVIEEMALRRAEAAGLVFDTIYLGGGTPSLLSPRQVARILTAAWKHFAIVPDAQITLEANPATVDGRRLQGYRAAGVNRLNLGVQSIDEGRLAFLGRIHTARQGLAAVGLARKAGFDDLGLDLIYGTPGQTPRRWAEELARVLALGPRHLSCYLLTLAPGTPLEKDRRRGRFISLDEEGQADLFETTQAMLAQAGFEHYEVSNFAGTRTWRSRHNLKYWTRAPYIGLGPAAHSFVEPLRCWNHRDLGRWLDDIGHGRRPEAGRESLSREQIITETIVLGLRTADGIDLDAFARRFGRRLEELAAGAIAALQHRRLIRLNRRRLRPSPKGFLLADGLAREIVTETRMKDESL